MKKISFAVPLVIFSLYPVVTQAQSHITIYGWTDLGYVRETGEDWKMQENDSNALGFKGFEDLGGGNKVTFDLQTRFMLQNGQRESSTNAEWEGASNMGLSGNWGSLRFGRMNEAVKENFSMLDPFRQDGPASMLVGSQRQTRISNTARYDSPTWNGLQLHAAYSLGEDSHDADNTAAKYGADNDGYALALKYDKGPLAILGGWGRLADSDNSSMLNLGAAYSYGAFRFSLGYEHTNDKGFKLGEFSKHDLAEKYGGTEGISSKQDSWIAGLKWSLGYGEVDALFNYARLKDVKVKGTQTKLDDSSIKKYALGYTYNLSKRTQLYSKVSFTDFDNKEAAAFYRGANLDDADAFTFQLGMFHRF